MISPEHLEEKVISSWLGSKCVRGLIVVGHVASLVASEALGVGSMTELRGEDDVEGRRSLLSLGTEALVTAALSPLRVEKVPRPAAGSDKADEASLVPEFHMLQSGRSVLGQSIPG